MSFNTAEVTLRNVPVVPNGKRERTRSAAWCTRLLLGQGNRDGEQLGKRGTTLIKMTAYFVVAPQGEWYPDLRALLLDDSGEW